MKSFISAKNSQKIMNSILIISGVVTIAILVIMLAYILIKGVPVMNLEFIFGQVENQGRSGGILPMIISRQNPWQNLWSVISKTKTGMPMPINSS